MQRQSTPIGMPIYDVPETGSPSSTSWEVLLAAAGDPTSATKTANTRVIYSQEYSTNRSIHVSFAAATATAAAAEAAATTAIPPRGTPPKKPCPTPAPAPEAPPDAQPAPPPAPALPAPQPEPAAHDMQPAAQPAASQPATPLDSPAETTLPSQDQLTNQLTSLLAKLTTLEAAGHITAEVRTQYSLMMLHERLLDAAGVPQREGVPLPTAPPPPQDENIVQAQIQALCAAQTAEADAAQVNAQAARAATCAAAVKHCVDFQHAASALMATAVPYQPDVPQKKYVPQPMTLKIEAAAEQLNLQPAGDMPILATRATPCNCDIDENPLCDQHGKPSLHSLISPQQVARRTKVQAALDFDSDDCSDLSVDDNGSYKSGNDTDEPDDSEYFRNLSKCSPPSPISGPPSPAARHISVPEAGEILAARTAELQKADQSLTVQERTEKRRQRQAIASRKWRKNEKAKAAAGQATKAKRQRAKRQRPKKPRMTIYLKADEGESSRPNLDRIPYNHPKIPGKELARRKKMTDSKKYGCAKCNYFWHCCKEGTLAAGKKWTPLIKMSDIF